MGFEVIAVYGFAAITLSFIFVLLFRKCLAEDDIILVYLVQCTMYFKMVGNFSAFGLLLFLKFGKIKRLIEVFSFYILAIPRDSIKDVIKEEWQEFRHKVQEIEGFCVYCCKGFCKFFCVFLLSLICCAPCHAVN